MDGEQTATLPPLPADAGGFSDLAGDHAHEFPAPNADAVAAEQDRIAAGLDPAVYVFKNGRPVLNKDGTFKKRTGPKPAAAGEDFESLGLVASETTFMLCCGILGSEWQPSDEERERLTRAWGVYLKAKGITDLPPGLVLAGAFVSYARPRLSQPDTTGRLVTFALWVRAKIGGMFKRGA